MTWLIVIASAVLLSSQALASDCTDDLVKKLQTASSNPDICKVESLTALYDVVQQAKDCGVSSYLTFANLKPLSKAAQDLSTNLQKLPDCSSELAAPLAEQLKTLWDKLYADYVKNSAADIIAKVIVAINPILSIVTGVFAPLAYYLGLLNGVINKVPAPVAPTS